MAASRASSPLFLRSDWRSRVLRVQYSAQTHSGRGADTRIQGPPEIQTERKIPAAGGEITGRKIKRGDAVDRKRTLPADEYVQSIIRTQSEGPRYVFELRRGI